VVAACDGGCSWWNYTAPVFIQFYSLVNGGEWTRSNSSFQFNTTRPYDVALSGNTTLVSFHYSPPLVFEQRASGEWEILSDPFVFRDNATKEWWATEVDVDGDLACLDSSIFRRNDSKWTEVDNFPTSYYCAISDGTIAVDEDTGYNDYQIQLYEYNEGQDAVLPIQDPIIPEDWTYNNLALSNDYLIYGNDTVLVYKRNSAKQTYIFHQELAVTDYIWDLSLHENTLAVAAYNQTHIFVERNSTWVELAVLEQVYEDVAVSGQNLVASTDTEVHSYKLQNIEDCMASTPSLES